MEFSPHTPEERDKLRAEIARANGFHPYKRYTEKEAAAFIGIHYQTLKETRLQGRIPYLRLGKRSIAYLGFQIADFIIGSIQWQKPVNRSTDSGKSGLREGTVATPSTDIGGTQSVDAQDALRSARQTLKKPSSD